MEYMKIKSSLLKIDSHHNELVNRYRMSVLQMITDMLCSQIPSFPRS